MKEKLVTVKLDLYLYPPVGRTACTEPQCLYKGALYFTFFYPYYSSTITH